MFMSAIIFPLLKIKAIEIDKLEEIPCLTS